MKNVRLVSQLTVITLAAIAIIIMLMRNSTDANALAMRIRRYESRADSLRQAVKMIDKSVHHKDSILLVYLASLDKTLEELNKEAAKNKKSIALNFSRQDSVRRAYCREMARLEQHPEECQ
ncbi:MAG TPA: hypothetical protein VGD65_01940 [Chryseosolibacter sp.]